MSNPNNALYVSSNWLDSPNTGDATATLTSSTTTNFCGGWTTYTYPYSTVYLTSNLTIDLTLTEVMHLRQLAANDHKLKKTLQKFSPYIRITVDF